MKPVTREQWTTALRSGEYEQARRRLYDGEGYCCLGVLCKLAGGIIAADNEIVLPGYHMSTAFIPDDLSYMVGISFPQQVTLSRMNDNGRTFAEIADYIDQLPKS